VDVSRQRRRGVPVIGWLFVSPWVNLSRG
jgi:hypothetical protein